MIYSYVLASLADSNEPEWRAVGGILPHLCAVEMYARMDSRSGRRLHPRLVEDESTIRRERRRYQQHDPTLPLCDCEELVTKNAVFPLDLVVFAYWCSLFGVGCDLDP